MYYFAYGSNMNIERMKQREVAFTERRKASVSGYVVRFNKDSLKGHGYANLNPAEPTDVVEGVLYRIVPEDINKLDKKEGYPKHYDKQEIEVLVGNETLKATVYIANQRNGVDRLFHQRLVRLKTLERRSSVSRGAFFIRRNLQVRI